MMNQECNTTKPTEQQLCNCNEKSATMELEKDSSVKNILLIGPSQNGKSSLANFLVNGKALSKEGTNIHFAMGDGMISETTECKGIITEWIYKFIPNEFEKNEEILKNPSAAKNIRKRRICLFRIIDAPGIGNTDENIEQQTMENLYRYLYSMKCKGEKLSLALLVLQYGTIKFNTELFTNIDFYKKMIPDLMTSNILLVVTNVQNNEKWIKTQMLGCPKHPSARIEVIRKQVQKRLGHDQKFLIPTETIDSLCAPKSTEEKEAIKLRCRVFEYCLSSAEVELNNIHLPKTQKLLRESKEKIDKLNGKREAKVNTCDIMIKLSEISKQLRTLETSLNRVNDELIEKNNTKMHPIFNATFTDKLHFFGWCRRDFDILTEFPICKKLVVLGFAKYTVDERTHINGMIYSKWFRSLHCQLTLYTEKKIFYEKEIKELQLQFKRERIEYKQMLDQYKLDNSNEPQFQTILDYTKKDIADIDKEIEYHSRNYIYIDEVQIRNLLEFNADTIVIPDNLDEDDEEELEDGEAKANIDTSK